MRTAKKTDLGSRRIYQLLSRLCRKKLSKKYWRFPRRRKF